MIKNIEKTFFKNFIDLVKSRTFIHIFLFLFVFLSMTFFTSFNFMPSSDIKAGEVSPKDIAAPKKIEVINEEATQKLRIDAAKKISPVYTTDPYITSEQEEKITLFFETVIKVRAYEKIGDYKKAAKLRKKLPLDIPADITNSLLQIDPAYLSKMENVSKVLFEKAMSPGVKTEDVPRARDFIDSESKNMVSDPSLQYLVAEVTKKAIAPNRIQNIAETKLLQQKKMEEVEPVKMIIQRGQVLVRKGEIVTPEQITLLKSLNLYAPTLDLLGILGAALFSLFFIILILYFIGKNAPRIFFDDKLLLLLTIIILLVVGVSKGLLIVSNYLAPVAAASLLIAILLDWRLAVLVTVLLSIQVGIFTNNISLVCACLSGGLAAIFSVTKINRRWDMVISAVIIITANCIILLVIGLVQTTPLDYLLKETILIGGVFNGIIAAALAVGTLPVFENAFNITTHIKLIELSSPNEPLLNKLLIEAPGTYHHSIVVGNLAYGAAQVVDADPLLARVMAYYHDIGKIKRPYYFVENQLKNDNPHDRISPTLSTLIIMSHIKDGLELAQKYRLPAIINDAIKEHHGTSMAAYFYHEAMSQADEEERNELSEEDFRYPGPKPQSKEAAIVMLADIAEASVKALDNVNQIKINNMVKQVIKSAFEDGQLDECQLSFKNLKDIQASFARTLSGMYHHRIEYPEKIAKKENGKEKTSS